MKIFKNNKSALKFVLVCLVISLNSAVAQVPDPNQGLRADWLRGAWGVNWKPENFNSGVIETVSINDYIEELKVVRTLDYIQVHLSESNIFSPSHSAPSVLLESFWQGDTNNGTPINLIVPRASSGKDPFRSWLEAIKAAGLKTMVYVNSYNLLARDETNIPSGFPNVSARWMSYCDTNATVQAFINSKSYHNGAGRRKYMFCYAEFVLKEYAIRYGDLIDAWGFDSADNIMADECGDNPKSDLLDDQRIYEAFANAVHAGNPNAAVAFNNSVGTAAAPFATPTYFEDFTFGHPFGGGGNMVETTSLYDRNFGVCELMRDTNGHPFTSDTRAWNDNVVGRFFPKLSTTSWNAGATPCLTNEQFVEWNRVGVINAGSILWGAPLIRNNLNNSPILTLQPLALDQLKLLDANFKVSQFPGAPNWARQATVLPDATIGIPYSHTLTEGVDLWDPEGDAITSLLAQGNFPSWLTITKTATGVWTLSGTPTETVAKDYGFSLQASDASGARNRTVALTVLVNSNPTTIDVQIKAAATTNYGVNAIATMYSEVQTAADGLATYRLAIEVTPPTGKAVISGLSGGSATVNSWGVGDGSDSNEDIVFRGSDIESVRSIKNIQIIDFNANGGNSTVSNLNAKFKSITIVNANSPNDNVSLSTGTATASTGKLDNSTQVVDLATALGVQNITDFAIGVGNASDSNKWSVEGITVEVVYDGSLLSNFSTTFDKEDAFILYPNPVKDVIHVNIPIHSVQIIDMTGKVVQTYSNSTEKVDVSSLSPGIYIIKGISDNGVTVTKRFIKG